MLIQASRTRSSVGLTREPDGALILRPRQRPATMRKLREAARRREAGRAFCCSRVARSDVSDSHLEVALPSIVVALESERDIDLRSGLEFTRAVSEAPPKRFERSCSRVEHELESVFADHSRRTRDDDVPSEENGCRISNSERLEVTKERLDAP